MEELWFVVTDTRWQNYVTVAAINELVIMEAPCHCWIDSDHCIQFEHNTVIQQKFGNVTLVYYFSTYSGIIQ